MLGASRECKLVIKSCGVNAVYLGGDVAEGCHPLIGSNLSEMCGTVLAPLIANNHQRITIMLPEVHNQSDKSASVAEERMKKVFEDHGLAFSTYNCPRWGKTREDFYEAMHKLFGVTPPTALILSDTSHLPRVVSFLMKRGIKFPDDLSLVVLDESSDVHEYDPPISYVKKANKKLAQVAVREAIKKVNGDTETASEPIFIPSELQVTGSINSI